MRSLTLEQVNKAKGVRVQSKVRLERSGGPD